MLEVVAGCLAAYQTRQLALLAARRFNPSTHQGVSVGSLPFRVGIRCRFVAVHVQNEMLHDCASADSWIPFIVGSWKWSKSSLFSGGHGGEVMGVHAGREG